MGLSSKRYCLYCEKITLYKLNTAINHSMCQGCANTLGIHPNNAILKHFLRKIKRIEQGKTEIKSSMEVKRLKNKCIEYRKIISGLHDKIKKIKGEKK